MEHAAPALSSHRGLGERIAFLFALVVVIAARGHALVTSNFDQMLDITHDYRVIGSVILSEDRFHENMRQLVDAEAYFSFALMITGTVVIPVLRFACMFWAYEFSTQHAHRRSKIIYFQDLLGRLMMIEFYGAMFSIVFFQSTVHTNLSGLGVQLKARLRPPFFWGIASNVLATLLTHYQMVLDRGINQNAPLQPTKPFPTNTPIVHVINTVISVALFALLVLRATLATYTMTGMMGKVTQRTLDVDLMTSVYGFPSALEPNERTMAVVAVVFDFMLCFGVPVGIAFGWFVLCYAPLGLVEQAALASFLPKLMSFLSLDVFALLCIANYFEANQVAEFLFEDKAPTLCNALAKYAHGHCAGVKVSFSFFGMFCLLLLCLGFAFVRVKLDEYNKKLEDIAAAKPVDYVCLE